MSKKFDVVIGNPPYQEEAQGGGTRDTPVYHLFMDAAYEVGKKVVLITPARFLFNAGFTSKTWNEKMLADPHLTVPIYVRDSSELFPGTKIRAGIAVTYRDDSRAGAPIGTFTAYPELKTILHKVRESGATFVDGDVSSGRDYAFTQAMHDDHPHAASKMSSDAQFRVSTNTFEQLEFLFHATPPAENGTYVRLLGVIKNKRIYRWIRSAYITCPGSFDKYKVAVPAANESNQLGQMAAPQVLGPGVGVTQTFLTIGAFDTEGEALACFAYVKTKFARAMLYVLKVTQHNPRSTWKCVPAQDFTSASDIDWSKSIPEIDQQLYAKYGLDDDEIAFIEEKVKPMD
ncbi:Eco57I restriction-modification methylase domain-containing protein [Kribbia dieselivorans]|uniref:Eco57I restriction-modification methylase domain-containing protein n=1 Tax=Kribbia dieselivorans TaxID=331526 RepID=UPI0008396C89|nr:Eco57I restriction-modification methylase domain-containing protein [Kribbia dieselivorans]